MAKKGVDTWKIAFKAGTMADMFDWSRATITLAGCLEVIRELSRTGSRAVSLKLAIWAGVTSINTKLAYNGNAVRALARYVEGALPGNFEGVKEALKGTSFGLMGAHYKAIKGAEDAEKAGTLPAVPQDTWTQAEWVAWRDEMVKLPGVSWKVASFIGLLICPETCPLVPVDRWVMRRLNLSDSGVPQARLAYMKVEDMVRDERNRAGHENLPLGAWHWYKWSEARQAAKAETPSERPESHDNLSPRWY